MKPHFSINQMDMLLKCGYQYYLAYIEKIRVKPGFALGIGWSTHKSAEKILSRKLSKKELPSREETADTARDAIAGWLKNTDYSLSAKEEAIGKAQAEAQAIDLTVNLALTHRDKLAPVIEPIWVERSWRLDLDGFPRELVGVIDCIETVEGETTRIRELKTAGKKPNDSDAHNRDQVTLYTLACETLDGIRPQATVDYLIKNKTPSVYSIDSSRSDADIQRLFYKLEAAFEALYKEAFFPNTAGWWCHPQWCGYAKSRCKYHRRDH